MTERETKTGTEIIAREIATWHGSHITGPTRTIAADHGFGSWGHSPEKYADRHWREYIGAAEAMLARINRIDAEQGASPMTDRVIELINEALNHDTPSRVPWRARLETALFEIDRLTRELAEARGQVAFQDGCIKACHHEIADARAEVARLTTYRDGHSQPVAELEKQVEFWRAERDAAVNHAVTYGPMKAENERLRDALNQIKIELLPAEHSAWLTASGERIMELIRNVEQGARPRPEPYPQDEPAEVTIRRERDENWRS